MSERRENVCLGNEAIARGIVESGCQFMAAYPGTPSSEILPAVVRFKGEENLDLYVEWSVNEKVAFENALVASYTGKRAAVAMKQVGLNVAADPLMSAAYIGTVGGFLIVSCDDPGPHSSQTEQDSRFMAMFAKVPVFDPASPREAHAMVPLAFDLSERFQIPVLLRSVMRVSHAQQTITFSPVRKPTTRASFQRNPQRWSATPRYRFILHRELNRKLTEISELFNGVSALNFIEGGRREARLGIIAGGISYAMARDLLREFRIDEEVPVLKIGTPYPLPSRIVDRFMEQCDRVLVLEETEPVIELQIRDKSKVTGRLDGRVPGEGEMTPEIVASVIGTLCREIDLPIAEYPETTRLEKMVADLGLPIRRPSLCSGCSHRATFFALKRAFPQGIFPSDIGCYTLGMNMEAVDTCHDMGAAITFASGLYQAFHQDGLDIPIFSTIGDSTFYHSGAPGLLNAVYNGARFVLVILDNSITAMTGMQPTPESGVTADGHPGRALSLEELVRGCGVQYVRVVNPYQIDELIREAKRAYRYTKQADGGIAVLIARYPCITHRKEQLQVNPVKVDVRHAPLPEKRLLPVRSGEMPPSLLPLYRDKIAPCQAACPLEVDARGYIALMKKGRFDEALALVRRRNPFPGITGRLCARPCEKVCRRGDLDEPVAIDLLKRFLADRDPGQNFKPSELVGPPREEKVAIVGSGPAGLMAAYDLRRQGYSVTIFEALPVAGGTMAVATPRFRLPEEVLRREIGLVQEMGVEIQLNTRVGGDFGLDPLRQQGYKAIFLAIGAQKAKAVDLPGENAEGVMDVLSFLRRTLLGEIQSVPETVVVLGGNERSVDAARMAVRLGAREVRVLFSRTRKEIPVDEGEIGEAEEEGVLFQFLSVPTRILTSDGKATGVCYKKASLSPPTSSGRTRIASLEGPEKRFRADWVITSPLYVPDVSGWEDVIARTPRDTIRIDPVTLATGVEGVFAGGDAVTGPKNFIEALAAGRKAASSIHRFLRGEELKTCPESGGGRTPWVAAPIHLADQAKRVTQPLLLPQFRREGFTEVRGLPDQEAILAEAERCLHCGSCYHCDRCMMECPEGAISKVDGRYGIDYSRCTGCRVCAEECPTSALEMPKVGTCVACGYCLKRFECPSLVRGEDGRVVINRLTCVDCGLCLRACSQGAIYRVR